MEAVGNEPLTRFVPEIARLCPLRSDGAWCEKNMSSSFWKAAG